jgi:hypothetical protein
MSEELAEGSLMALTPGQVRELERLGVIMSAKGYATPVPEGRLCRDLATAKCCAAT